MCHKFYALAAAFAILKYVEFVQNIIYAPKVKNKDFKQEIGVSTSSGYFDIWNKIKLHSC